MTNSKLIEKLEALKNTLPDDCTFTEGYLDKAIALIQSHESDGVDGYKQVGFTGSGSISSMELGGEGHIWGNSADAHPVPVYIRSALRTPEQPQEGKVKGVAHTHAVLAERCPKCRDYLIHNNRGVECGAIRCDYERGGEPYGHPAQPDAYHDDAIMLDAPYGSSSAQPDKAEVVEYLAGLLRAGKIECISINCEQMAEAIAALPPTRDDGGLAKELEAARGVIIEWERDMKGTLAALEAERTKVKELAVALDQIKRLAITKTISPGFCLPHIDDIADRALEKAQQTKAGV